MERRDHGPVRRVFISYRRHDSRYVAGRLRERLAEAFGDENVFLDVDMIELGSDYPTVLVDAVRSCDVVLLIIGSRFDPARLFDQRDYIRMELLEAITQRKQIVPVLVEGTGMPRVDEIPHELASLRHRQAAEVRSDPDFRHDVARLIEKLRSARTHRTRSARRRFVAALRTASRRSREHRPRTVAGAGLIVAAVAVLAVVTSRGSPGDRLGGGAGTGSTTATTGAGAPDARGDGADADPTCEGVSDGRLTLGALIPRTGDLSHHQPAVAAGAALAVADVNGAGGVLGNDIALLQDDSGDGAPDVATSTVGDHIDAGADVLLDAAGNRVSFAVIDTITGSCRIQFSPSAASSSLTTYDDDDLFFRTVPSNALQGQALAELALEEGGGAAAILYRQDGYGETLGQAIVVTALAALVAGTDEPSAVARRINDITRRGSRCSSFAECAALAASGEDVDYDGQSGPLEFSQQGEPTVGTYRVERYGDDNRIASVDYRTVRP